MAKSALLEQFSDIWLDKQDYLEAERIYYEGKLSQILAGNFNNSNNKDMGRKNKSKQSAAGPAAPATETPQATPPTLIAPPPSDLLDQTPPPAVVVPNEPAAKKRNDSECSNKSKGGKGKNKQGQQQQAPKQPSPPRQDDTVPEESSPSSPSIDSNSCGGKKGGGQTKAHAGPEPKMDGIAKLSGGDSPALVKKIATLESENKAFKKDIQSLTELVKKLEIRLSSLEKSGGGAAPKPAASKPAAPAKDDDVDLFGSDDEESEEAAKIREERVAAYNAKKSKKPVLIAKSNIILDVKPWGDDTDMKEMEKLVRAIQMDGLLWGASKLAPLAYGINKLQISCVVEDDLVSVDALTEAIQDIEEYVQSVDIAAFNKV